MGSRGTKNQVLRRSFVALALVGLVGMFFAFNYFFFIPQQHRSYNRKIFRVLNEAANGFKSRLEGEIDYFSRKETKPPELKLEPGKINGPINPELFARSFNGLKYQEEKQVPPVKLKFQSDSIQLLLLDSVEKNSLYAALEPETKPIDSLLDPSLEKLHRNIFDLVILVHRDTIKNEKNRTAVNNRLLYKKGILNTGSIFQGDSLFTDNNFLQFASVTELEIEGTRYKAFALPFQFRDQELILTGFIEESNYRVNTSNYSQPALLWILSILILIILILPFIKIFMMSRQERISSMDVRLLIVALVTAPFILTLAATTFQLYHLQDLKTDKQLRELRHAVTDGFNKEIGTAIEQLKLYEQLLDSGDYKKAYASLNAGNNNPLLPGMMNLKEADSTDFKNLFFYPTIYKNLDDIYWVNGEGRQIAKWFFLFNPVSYLDVKERTYFKKLRDGEGFLYRHDSLRLDTFYIEPTISWATGDYSVNILTNSHHRFPTTDNKNNGQAIMAGLAASMHSFTDAIVPKGFNFCIIDGGGQVLFHSEKERSLHENLFEETNWDHDFANAVAKKDEKLLTDLSLFDHQVKLLVSPMKGLPFYFVSYFNLREQNLFVFHIAGFTLLCMSLGLLCLLVFILMNHFTKFENTPLHFQMYESALMRPSAEKYILYKQIFALQGILVLVWLLLFFVTGKNQEFILLSGILFPFLLSTGYYIIKTEYNNWNSSQKSSEGKKEESYSYFLLRNGKLITLFVLFLGLLLYILWKLLYEEGEKQEPAAWMATIFLVLGLPLISRSIVKWIPLNDKPSEKDNPAKKLTAAFAKALFPQIKENRHFYLYCIIILIAILLISVLPSLSILNYAYREETKAQTKAQQFHLAENLEKRRQTLNAYFKKTKLNTPGANAHQVKNYIANRKFSTNYGIYLPDQFKIDTMTISDPRPDSTLLVPNSTSFYQLITQFLFLPKDHADFFNNNPFYWWQKKSDSNRILQLNHLNQFDKLSPESIQVSTTIRKGSLFNQLFFSNYTGRFIFLWLLIFTVIYFFLIRTVTKKIFLLDYHLAENGSNKKEQDPEWLKNQLNGSGKVEEETKNFFGGNAGLTRKRIKAKENQFPISSAEGVRNILHIQYLLTPVYHRIWDSLTDEEKFILYDFSLDGFTNHKNIDILYGLMQKGLICKGEQQLELMNYSFRNYLLGKAGSKNIQEIKGKISTGSNWENMKLIFYVVFLGIMIFLFTTQQEVSDKIIAVVTGIVTLVPLILKLFDRNLLLGTSEGKEQSK